MSLKGVYQFGSHLVVFGNYFEIVLQINKMRT
jgi:hypothetical protein